MQSHTHLYEDKYLDLRRSLLFLQCFEGKDTRSFSRDVGHETNIVSRYRWVFDHDLWFWVKS